MSDTTCTTAVQYRTVTSTGTGENDYIIASTPTDPNVKYWFVTTKATDLNVRHPINIEEVIPEGPGLTYFMTKGGPATPPQPTRDEAAHNDYTSDDSEEYHSTDCPDLSDASTDTDEEVPHTTSPADPSTPEPPAKDTSQQQ